MSVCLSVCLSVCSLEKDFQSFLEIRTSDRYDVTQTLFIKYYSRWYIKIEFNFNSSSKLPC